MMGTTHALMGLLLGSSILIFRPEFLALAGIAGFIGGLLPDFDMPLEHRKTLHFPTYYTVLAAVALPLMIVFPTEATVFIFYILLSAAIHSYIDVFGGGLEERPWEGTSNRGVYHHRRGEWLEPKRIIRYDGAPEDFLIGLVLAVPSLVIYDPRVEQLIYVTLGVSLVYALLRKKIVDWAPDWLKDIF